jgi:hypothetical protein
MAPVVMPLGFPLLLAVPPAVPPKLLLPPPLPLPLLPVNIPPSSPLPYWLVLALFPQPEVELKTTRMPPPTTAPSVDHRLMTSSLERCC